LLEKDKGGGEINHASRNQGERTGTDLGISKGGKGGVQTVKKKQHTPHNPKLLWRKKGGIREPFTLNDNHKEGCRGNGSLPLGKAVPTGGNRVAFWWTG